jgi:hypothetical protein
MNSNKSSLKEVASNAAALKTARSAPIQQESQPVENMDFIRSLMLDIPVQSYRPAPVQESLNIERMLEAHLEADARKLSNSGDPVDHVSVDIPLLIRLFELLREGVKSDVEVHNIVERMLSIKEKGVLTMDDYVTIAGGNISGTEKEHAPKAIAVDQQGESLAAIKKLAGL